MVTEIPTVEVSWYFVLAVALFTIGVYGVLTQRSGIKILMSVEMMLNASHINFVAFSSQLGLNEGYAYTLIGIALAAAESAIGLAILVNLYRSRSTVNADEVNSLRW
jgi:F420H2 dehydrogenase subunit K